MTCRLLNLQLNAADVQGKDFFVFDACNSLSPTTHTEVKIFDTNECCGYEELVSSLTIVINRRTSERDVYEVVETKWPLKQHAAGRATTAPYIDLLQGMICSLRIISSHVHHLQSLTN